MVGLIFQLIMEDESTASSQLAGPLFSNLPPFNRSSLLLDPQSSRRYCKDLQSVRSRNPRTGQLNTAFLWDDQQLQEWASLETSSLIVVKGDSQTRELAEAVALDVVEYLVEKEQPAVWVLNATDQRERETGSNTLNIEDLLQYLAIQILQRTHILHSAQSLRRAAMRLGLARTQTDWIDAIRDALDVIPVIPYMFVVVDLGILRGDLNAVALYEFFVEMKRSISNSSLKLMMVTSWPLVSATSPQFIVDISRHSRSLFPRSVFNNQTRRGFNFPLRRQHISQAAEKLANMQSPEAQVRYAPNIGEVSANESKT